MRDLLPFIITGAVSGSAYGLAGVGLVLTYRTSGVFNFGHGAVAAGAAFLFYTLHISHGVPWPIAGSATLLLFGVIAGFVLERVTRGLADVPEAVAIVATIGLLLGIEGYLFLQYGNVTRNFPEFLPTSGFVVGGVTVTWAQVITVAISTCSTFGLYAFLRRSRLGVAMRAVVDNPTLLALAGENPRRVRSAAWSIGSVFAALSGILLAPTLGLDANLLTFLVVQAFGACAIGMFSSLPVTYVGGLAVGVAASLATKYFTDPPFNGVPAAVPFLVLFVVLLVVPSSRFPRRKVGSGSLIPDVKPLRRSTATTLVVVGVVAFSIVPLIVGTRLPVWTSALIDVVVFASLALLVWTSGQISLSHAAFVAVGATAMSHLTGNGVPWAFALLLAGIVAVPVGALVAIPAIRLSGLYLALATLGFGILMQYVVYPTWLMFGSKLSVSVARPHLGPLDATNDKHFYYLVLIVAFCCLSAIVLVANSRLGRLLRAMSETPVMLATHGLGVNVTRLIVFCISAFFAGVAGGLAVTQFGSASGAGYSPISSLLLIAVLAMCGTRLLRSSIIGAVLLAVLPGYVQRFDVNHQTFVFGMFAIGASIVIAKRGLLPELIRRSTQPDVARTAWRRSADARPTLRSQSESRVPVGMLR